MAPSNGVARTSCGGRKLYTKPVGDRKCVGLRKILVYTSCVAFATKTVCIQTSRSAIKIMWPSPARLVERSAAQGCAGPIDQIQHVGKQCHLHIRVLLEVSGQKEVTLLRKLDGKLVPLAQSITTFQTFALVELGLQQFEPSVERPTKGTFSLQDQWGTKVKRCKVRRLHRSRVPTRICFE